MRVIFMCVGGSGNGNADDGFGQPAHGRVVLRDFSARTIISYFFA